MSTSHHTGVSTFTHLVFICFKGVHDSKFASSFKPTLKTKLARVCFFSSPIKIVLKIFPSLQKKIKTQTPSANSDSHHIECKSS